MDKKETKKTIWVFALASFLNDFGSDMIYSVWPLFLTVFLGANVAVLGLIDGLGDAVVSISQAVSGYLSDKIKKRKVFIWTGYILGVLSRIGYALSISWNYIIPFRILDRSGKIRNAPRDAIVADISAKKERGKNFGILRTFDNLGAIAGILTSILLFGTLGYRKLFLIAAVPSLIGAVILFVYVKERRTIIKISKGISFKDLNHNFKLFLLASSFFALGSFSYSFLLVYAQKFGFKAAFIPVLYLIFTLVAFLFSYYFGKLSDKIGRKSVVFISFIFWLLTCLTLVFAQSYLFVIIAFILYGLYKAAFETVQRAFVAELAPVKFRASTLGGFQMIVGLIALPASVFAGVLWINFNKFVPFYFSIALTVISMIILMFVKEK